MCLRYAVFVVMATLIFVRAEEKVKKGDDQALLVKKQNKLIDDLKDRLDKKAEEEQICTKELSLCKNMDHKLDTCKEKVNSLEKDLRKMNISDRNCKSQMSEVEEELKTYKKEAGSFTQELFKTYNMYKDERGKAKELQKENAQLRFRIKQLEEGDNKEKIEPSLATAMNDEKPSVDCEAKLKSAEAELENTLLEITQCRRDVVAEQVHTNRTKRVLGNLAEEMADMQTEFKAMEIIVVHNVRGHFGESTDLRDMTLQRQLYYDQVKKSQDDSDEYRKLYLQSVDDYQTIQSRNRALEDYVRHKSLPPLPEDAFSEQGIPKKSELDNCRNRLEHATDKVDTCYRSKDRVDKHVLDLEREVKNRDKTIEFIREKHTTAEDKVGELTLELKTVVGNCSECNTTLRACQIDQQYKDMQVQGLELLSEQYRKLNEKNKELEERLEMEEAYTAKGECFLIFKGSLFSSSLHKSFFSKPTLGQRPMFAGIT